MKFSHVLTLRWLFMMMVAQPTWADVSELSTLNTGEGAKVHSELANSQAKVRFIPVELFTGAKWDGKHELKMADVSTATCASADGKPCDKYEIQGPFKTATNDTKIAWAGDTISYYRRTFTIPRRGDVVSFFTINNSRDGMVRIYDKRKRWGVKTYSGLGSKFPLGYWKQGEVRRYGSRTPTSIEIIELDGPDHCLTFRWVIGDGKERNSDNNYTFCPDRGLTNINHNHPKRDPKT